MAQVLNTALPTDTTPAPEGYEEKMIAKFEAQVAKPDEAPETASDDRPTWLPEKFKSPEELAKAYAELEKKLGQPKTEEAPPATEEAPKADEAAQEAVKEAGLDWASLENEVVETGSLSEASYAALEKAGIPKNLVDNYIAGLQAQSEKITTEVLGAIGGRENFDAMAAWMTKTLPAADIEAFNKVMESRDLSAMKLAMQGMYSQYTGKVGVVPKLVKATTSADTSGPTFRSTAELTAAMRDPRYRTDAAYRADVQARLERSSIF